MSEGPSSGERTPSRKERMIALARELSERPERFPFPGLDPASHALLRAAEREHPGYMAPIDERVQRLRNEGMKVVLGQRPEDGNIYILPGNSNGIYNDSISPKYLQTIGGMDGRLKELIELSRR